MKNKIDKLECLRCGHEWVPRKEEVRQCPKCKSAWWDMVLEKCEVCNRTFSHLAVHHKDGNKNNNEISNKLKICVDCHSVIHNGLNKEDRKTLEGKTKKSRIRKYKDENIKEELFRLRELWLKKKELRRIKR